MPNLVATEVMAAHSRAVLVLVLEHQAHRPLPHLLWIPRLSVHAPILSKVGASNKPGAVHAVTAAVDRVVEELGTPYILVNNAGIDIVRMFVDTDEALWRRLIDVNYIGFLAVTHAVAPKMIEKKTGLMINIGSDAGRVGNPGDVVYCGTKAAMMATSKALAREFARYGIRVNCVAPGPIRDTELLDDFYEGEMGERMAKMVPLRRLGTPEDVADVVGFFASEGARYLTGQILSVDGGLTMIS